MKTITLQGEFQKFENLYQATSKFDADRLPYEVETRVYVVDKLEHNTSTLTDEMFMTLAEGLGRVYTLQGFEKAVNNDDLYLDESYIRFLSVPLF